MPGSGRGWGLPPGPLPPRPAPLLRPRATSSHPRAALLLVRQRRVRRAQAPDLRARLRLLGPRPGAALLPRTLRRLRAQPGLQVRALGGMRRRPGGSGSPGACRVWEGAGQVCRCERGVGSSRAETGRGRAGPPAHGPPAAPRRPRLLAFQASCAPAPSAPDGCLQDQAPRCLRAFAGLVGTHCGDPGAGGGLPGMPAPEWADYPVFGVPAGTAITPNYVDNASARVAPWCDCGASGNRREECEAFRGLFTRNQCLGEGPWAGRRRHAPSQV